LWPVQAGAKSGSPTPLATGQFAGDCDVVLIERFQPSTVPMHVQRPCLDQPDDHVGHLKVHSSCHHRPVTKEPNVVSLPSGCSRR